MASKWAECWPAVSKRDAVYKGPEILSKWRTAYAPDTGLCVRETATHAGPNTYSSPAGFILEGRARGTKLACPVRSPPEMSLPFNHPASLLFGSTEPSARKGPPIFSLTWRGRETTEIIGGKSSRGTRDTIVFPATCHYLRIRFIVHIRVCIIRHWNLLPS